MKVMKRGILTFSYVPVEKLNRLTQQPSRCCSDHIYFIFDLESIESVIENGKTVVLILDQISDARNFGAIIRTAECTGVNGIVVQKAGSAPVNGYCKTSAGAVFNIPICKVEHIKDAIFASERHKTVAATEKTDQTIYDITLNEPVAIIMGSEDRGVNPSVLRLLTKSKASMFGTIGSLNVSRSLWCFYTKL
jgi:23S rRNA (guanosine2251-2'-O)-methyltransferase